MAAAAPLLLFLLPVLVYCQEYTDDYHCNFEDGDCGFRNVSFTGAHFRYQEISIGDRRTRCLVLQSLPFYGNWTFGRTRSAQVSSPVVLPGQYGSMSVRVDYYLVKNHCVDYIQINQLTTNGSIPLKRINVPCPWCTAAFSIADPRQPIKLVLEATLQPSCQDYRTCSCYGTVIFDNLRIQTRPITTWPPTPRPTWPPGPNPTWAPGPNPTWPPGTNPTWPPEYFNHWRYFWHKIKKIGGQCDCPCPEFEPCRPPTIIPAVPCPPVHRPDDCPPPPPPEICPPCPPRDHRPCPPVAPCPPIKPCPAILPCMFIPDKSTWDDKTGSPIPQWDPILQRDLVP